MTEARPISEREIIFPPWFDKLFRMLSAGGAFGVVYVAGIVNFGFSPKTTDAGYMPEQPIPYSHRLHVGELGLDCRYCHTGVEVGAKALIPPTQTCMQCHTKVLPDSSQLEPLRESYQTGKPVEWVRVHDLPDYVYFNHSAHVARGVGCVSCHGRVDQMEEVYQDQPLSMGWCLDCHRNPERMVRPLDRVTDLDYHSDPANDHAQGRQLLMERGWTEDNWDRKIRELTSCSTCHR